MALCLVITGTIVIQPRLLFLLDIERRNGQAKAEMACACRQR